MPSAKVRAANALRGLRVDYVRFGRTWHYWMYADKLHIAHIAPRVMDDFGNSVRVPASRIHRFISQHHD